MRREHSSVRQRPTAYAPQLNPPGKGSLIATRTLLARTENGGLIAEDPLLHVNLLFQTISNVPNSVLPTVSSLNNMSLCLEGLVAIDFQQFHIITEKMKKPTQTEKNLKTYFGNFLYSKINTIITNLKH